MKRRTKLEKYGIVKKRKRKHARPRGLKDVALLNGWSAHQTANHLLTEAEKKTYRRMTRYLNRVEGQIYNALLVPEWARVDLYRESRRKVWLSLKNDFRYPVNGDMMPVSPYSMWGVRNFLSQHYPHWGPPGNRGELARERASKKSDEICEGVRFGVIRNLLQNRRAHLKARRLILRHLKSLEYEKRASLQENEEGRAQ